MQDDPRKVLGAKAKRLRKARGLRQRDAVEQAAKHGHLIALSTYSHLETGAINWSTRHMQIVADALNVSVSEFLPGSPLTRSTVQQVQAQLQAILDSDDI